MGANRIGKGIAIAGSIWAGWEDDDSLVPVALVCALLWPALLGGALLLAPFVGSYYLGKAFYKLSVRRSS